MPYLSGFAYIHSSKKVTQHDFDRLYFFYPGSLFIKFDIPRKPVYLPFDWCLICKGCFTESRAGWVNWGWSPKGKVAKLIRLYGKCMLCQVFGCMHLSTAHSLCRNLRRTEWAVGTHACIQSQKESAKLHIYHAFPIQSDQVCNFYLWRLPLIYSPCTRPSETILTNKASIERQINRLSRDV